MDGLIGVLSKQRGADKGCNPHDPYLCDERILIFKVLMPFKLLLIVFCGIAKKRGGKFIVLGANFCASRSLRVVWGSGT